MRCCENVKETKSHKLFIAYASKQGPDEPVQMCSLSRAFTAYIQSMEVDVKAQYGQSLRCLTQEVWKLVKSHAKIKTFSPSR